MKKILLTMMVFGSFGAFAETIVLKCNPKYTPENTDWIIQLDKSSKKYKEFWSEKHDPYGEGIDEGIGIFTENTKSYQFISSGTGKCNVYIERTTGAMHFCGERDSFQCEISNTSYSAHRKKAIQFHDALAKKQIKKNKF
jgi:hypothetical protein